MTSLKAKHKAKNLYVFRVDSAQSRSHQASDAACAFATKADTIPSSIEHKLQCQGLQRGNCYRVEHSPGPFDPDLLWQLASVTKWLAHRMYGRTYEVTYERICDRCVVEFDPVNLILSRLSGYVFGKKMLAKKVRF